MSETFLAKLERTAEAFRIIVAAPYGGPENIAAYDKAEAILQQDLQTEHDGTLPIENVVMSRVIGAAAFAQNRPQTPEAITEISQAVRMLVKEHDRYQEAGHVGDINLRPVCELLDIPYETLPGSDGWLTEEGDRQLNDKILELLDWAIVELKQQQQPAQA